MMGTIGWLILVFRLGAVRRAMLSHRARDATTPKGQYEPPSVGFSSSPAASRLLHDAFAS